MHSWCRRITLSLILILSGVVLLGSCTDDNTPTPSAEPPDCPTTLDENTLERLTLSLTTLSPTIEMQPGEVYTFTLGVVECCYVFEAVPACAAWSIEPATGAHIDPHSGLFSVDAETPSGSVFTVRADVEQGRRVVSIDVHVFTPQANPLARLWREEAQLTCADGEEVAPASPIGELRFRADGTFGVTWHPFEMYVDYWGTYTYSLEGALELTITGGNYVPDDVDGIGSFSFDAQGYLVLEDMWLGSPMEGVEDVNCGHRFY
ncbi:MAG: hypothetical protein PVF45_09635 [Anaerolineae bacterium]